MTPEAPGQSAPFTRDTVLVASPDHVSSVMGSEAVILGMLDGIYYGLDGVGSRIWELIQSARSMGSVADTIVSEYNVDASRAWEDLCALTDELVSKGLVVRDPATSP
jgi:hypothetical protein